MINKHATLCKRTLHELEKCFFGHFNIDVHASGSWGKKVLINGIIQVEKQQTRKNSYQVEHIQKDMGVEELYSVSRGNSRLVVAKGSVINFKGDCIVNAANEGGLGGGGIDGAINAAGGPQLTKARQALPADKNGTRIPTGQARITIAGNLGSKWIAHAVGPRFSAALDKARQNQQLQSAYRNAIDIAIKKNATSIGFALLSAGIFKGPRSLENVLKLGWDAVIQWCDDHADTEKRIDAYFVAFKDEEKNELLRIAKFDESPIDTTIPALDPNVGCWRTAKVDESAAEVGSSVNLLFGYGSLMWRPAGVPHTSSFPASVKGFRRRFWQDSTDHRGTPTKPGKVVVLLRSGTKTEIVSGMAYQLEKKNILDTLKSLDIREKDGYTRTLTDLYSLDGTKPLGKTFVYYSGNDSPTLNIEDIESIAKKISSCHGPSGKNIDYLERCHLTLKNMGVDDEHITSVYKATRKYTKHNQ